MSPERCVLIFERIEGIVPHAQVRVHTIRIVTCHCLLCVLRHWFITSATGLLTVIRHTPPTELGYVLERWIMSVLAFSVQVDKFRAAIEEVIERLSDPTSRRVAQERLATWLSSMPSTSQQSLEVTPKRLKRKWLLSRKCARLLQRFSELSSEEEVCAAFPLSVLL